MKVLSLPKPDKTQKNNMNYETLNNILTVVLILILAFGFYSAYKEMKKQ